MDTCENTAIYHKIMVFNDQLKNMNVLEIKSDRRERKLNARRKMRVVGKSVKLILDIVRKRALGIKNKKP